MLRAMSTRRDYRGYEPLASGGAPVDKLLSEAKMIRSRTLPMNFFGESPVTFESELRTPAREHVVDKQSKKVSKVHPIFSIFEKRGRRKKATAKPEFSRYLQYLKEGGIWNANESKPVIY
ncbi:hypothetical protein HanXRQr2_Chr14g0642101 [Helianthus annuus]|uniref:Uncharacterized protein n=2 Tax=Helianthus annuus TaxID=4232 RepID=A0A251SH77_HELAN|nr:hypothetical protein HanXRQr2_Chr14g0642101 [Helianthus annuus]KAJ0464065.1 hypothetical protein HanHA300_Chr14g0522781 [Helianthus annuus]KAJ0485605.1 hypothetical protein HanHA89_Chr14g0570191 [Helianthus annuus]KAJ0656156.1 hypothetical protein HanLR1_Chr14g0532571 [Helianthus annuus]KAJ0840210.1 hypothetical protein HanPSC8_Chr14g0615951 [Helianthus annuus]